MIYDKHANLKYKFGNRHFWSEGYYVSTVGLNEATIKKYIQDQEKYDIMQDKLSVKDTGPKPDPHTEFILHDIVLPWSCIYFFIVASLSPTVLT